MSPYTLNAGQAAADLASDTTRGLSAAEAEKRLNEHGPNALSGGKKRSLAARFFSQFKDVMIIILLIAAGISFGIAIYEGEAREFFEPSLILLIVVANAVIGVMQESRAEKALEALQDMSAPTARAIRDGQERIVEAANLVPGDVIRLEAGDFVPADARLISSASLKCEESALTGESVPVDKYSDMIIGEGAALGDRLNMVYSGCSVSYGSATALVTATGMDTEIGKIAGLLNRGGQEQTPLQKKLANLGKMLGIVALGVCAVIFAIGLSSGMGMLEIFMISISLAVSAIPEGLPAVVTVVLSMGVRRMVDRNAIIRRLPAVETLGSASVICSDKTGTLTQNRMTLTSAFVPGDTDIETISTANSESVKRLVRYAALCSNGSIYVEDGEIKHVGDPTETAIIMAAHLNGMEKDEINRLYPRLAELPFDSDRKLMSTINEIDGRLTVIVKGAFDVLEGRCKTGVSEDVRARSDEMSEGALRVLAVGYRHIDSLPDELSPGDLERDLTFMGLIGMIDPPREEARQAVATCRRAGIKPVMITGDHIKTAVAIARRLDIYREGDRALTGAELDALSDSQLDAAIREISVYARVSPENKIRIVNAWQRAGEVVAMTGDGVNDAPALNAADIGCAMGITGTDVAKGAADMVLTDDNFATIVDAVNEGRGIYSNIRKVVGFLLGTNIGELITVFAAMIIWREAPLLSMQLLWINLVTDSMPAIALGMEALEPDIMDRAPTRRGESIFAGGLGVRIILQSILFAAVTLIGYTLGVGATGHVEGGRTMAFLVLAMTQVFHSFSMRSEHPVLEIGIFSNRQLNRAALISSALMAVVLFTPARIAFDLVLLPARMYFIGLGLAIAPPLIVEAVKFIRRKK